MSASLELHNDPGIPSGRRAQRSILIATLDDLSIPHHLAGVISSVTRSTIKHLTIIFVSKLFDQPSSTSESQETSISHTQRWSEVQSLLTFVYVQATRVAQELDRVLMEVDVLLKGMDETLPDDFADGVDILYRVHDGQLSKHVLSNNFILKLWQDIMPLPHPLSSIQKVSCLFGDEKIPSTPPISSPPHPDAPPLYPVVVLGGTFDHLHAGHKILLSMAAWITSEKIIVGVTGAVIFNRAVELF
jgi:pantetheine-phosphate adenylyltransferase